MKKIIALAMCGVFAASSLCACNNIPQLKNDGDVSVPGDEVQVNAEDTILTIGDYKVDAAAYKYFFRTIQKDYLAGGEVDFTSEEFKAQFDKEILDYFKSNAATYNYAKSVGVDVDNVDQTVIDEITQYYTQMFAMYYGLDINEIYGEQLPEMMKLIAINEEVTQLEMAKVTDEEIKAYVTENYASAKHILVATTDDQGNKLEGEAFEEKKALADSLYQRAIAGEDFDALIKEYGEDPGMEASPEGYTFGPGEMVEEFYQGTLALSDNQIGEPVETSYGYHIIMRLPLALTDEEIAENRDTYAYAIIESGGRIAEVQSAIQALVDTTPVEFTDAYYEITFDTFMEELEAEIAAEKAEAEAAAKAEAEAQAKAEAEAEVEVEAEAESEAEAETDAEGEAEAETEAETETEAEVEAEAETTEA